ncbi:MAG TPA: acyltransferase [Puia sp.]
MKYVRSFDGLRAVSIFFVLLAHLGIYRIFETGSFGMTHVWPLFSGETGVTVFFALSGFLITRILLIEQEKFGQINLKNFYIRRFLRLLPPLVVFFTLVFVLMRTHRIDESRTSLLYSFFYLYNFVPNGIYISELAHTWSLAVEEQFYFTWPLFLLLLRPRKSLYIGMLLIGLCIVAKVVLPGMSVSYFYRTNRWFFPAVAPIIIGSMSAILLAEYKQLPQLIAGKYRLCLAAALVFFLSPLYLPDSLVDYAYMFQAIAASLLLAILLLCPDIALSKFLGWRPLVYIGKISYSLYVFQGLFLRNAPGGPLLIHKFPLNILLTFIVAILSYHFVETPILRLKEKFVTREKKTSKSTIYAQETLRT